MDYDNFENEIDFWHEKNDTKCDFCGKAFSKMSDLKRHSAAAHLQQSFGPIFINDHQESITSTCPNDPAANVDSDQQAFKNIQNNQKTN